jgi:hypothetical protein
MFDENLQHSLEDVMRRYFVKHRYLARSSPATTLAPEYEVVLTTSEWGSPDPATATRWTADFGGPELCWIHHGTWGWCCRWELQPWPLANPKRLLLPSHELVPVCIWFQPAANDAQDEANVSKNSIRWNNLSRSIILGLLHIVAGLQRETEVFLVQSSSTKASWTLLSPLIQSCWYCRQWQQSLAPDLIIKKWEPCLWVQTKVGVPVLVLAHFRRVAREQSFKSGHIKTITPGRGFCGGCRSDYCWSSSTNCTPCHKCAQDWRMVSVTCFLLIKSVWPVTFPLSRQNWTCTWFSCKTLYNPPH